MRPQIASNADRVQDNRLLPYENQNKPKYNITQPIHTHFSLYLCLAKSVVLFCQYVRARRRTCNCLIFLFVLFHQL